MKKRKSFLPTFLFIMCLLAAAAAGLIILFFKSSKPETSDTENSIQPTLDLSAGDFSFNTPESPTATPFVYSTPSPTNPETANEINALAKSLLVYMKNFQDERVPSVLEEMTSIDPAAAERWEALVNYWFETEQPGFINHNILPDGLPEDNSFCIIVLGYKLTDNGNIKPELEGRLKVALACAEKYPNAYLLVTGGGTAENRPNVTEAGQMAKWLENNGIDKNRILKETHSKSTAENIKYSYTLLSRDYPEITSVAVVSSDYHVARGCLFFAARFLEKGSPVHVVSNAAYVTEKSGAESREVLASGVQRLMEIK